MTNIGFEWDEAKNRSNQRKHGVSFEIATRVFADPFALTEQDRIEGGEMRWQTIGTVGGFLCWSWPTRSETRTKPGGRSR
ncbi:hypothetical protein BH10PSE6_BH10PSE6_14590 [soil metagenome]